jgi:hypothetical protein
VKSFIALSALTALKICAGTISYTGALTSPEDSFQIALTIPTSGTVILQTWGFGGGTNAAGTPIPAGGFDPLVAVFDSTGLLVEGTSDALTNYGTFMGCPPAGTVVIGNIAGNCGDITMTLNLAAGSYTILLADAVYIPNAIFDNGTLSEGFTDLTGGSFPLQTCFDANNCNNDTANWALDVTAPVPEPAAVAITAMGLLLLAVRSRYRFKQ